MTLDSFDGSEWTSSDSFRVAGPVLAADAAASGAVTLTEHVTLSTLAPPYLPVAGRPVRIDASLGPSALIGFDPDSGTLVTDAASLAGGSYTVIAEGHPADPDLANAAAGSGAASVPYTYLPPVPASLAALAARITARAHTPYAKLLAVDDYLRKLPSNRNAPPGDSFGTLARLLSADSLQGEAGYADQHASAFVILARSEHLPTRVVVGYRLPAEGTGQGTVRTYTVTTADAYAWAQAYFQGYGWIDFDPTDTRDTVRLPPVVPTPVQPPGRPPVTQPGSTSASAPAGNTPVSSFHPVNKPFTGSRPGLGSWQVPLELGAALLAVLLCLAIIVMTAGRRLLRRYRRHSAPTM